MRSLRERFDEKWLPEPNTGCWLWMGTLSPKGYGQYRLGRRGSQFAHRHAWAFYRGPIPDGLVIDHLCRVRSCVNPDHLRLVTPEQNVTENSLGPTAINKGKTHCVHGHPLSGENLLNRTYGRVCRTCNKARLMAAYVRKHRGNEKSKYATAHLSRSTP